MHLLQFPNNLTIRTTTYDQTAPSLLHNLPSDLWLHLIRFLKLQDIHLLQQLSIHFYHFSWNHLINKLLFSKNCTQQQLDPYLQLTAKPHMITLIRASHCLVTDKVLLSLSSFTLLQSLNLSNSLLFGNGLKHLTSLTLLSSLDLSKNQKLNNYCLQYIPSMVNLKKLNLSYCLELSNGVNHLKKLSNLNTLNLSQCIEITDSQLEHLSFSPKLKRLDVSYCDLLTDVGFGFLNHLTTLTELRMKQCAITDKGLMMLTMLKNLVLLDVAGCKKVGLKGLKFIVQRGLKKLDIVNCQNAGDMGMELTAMSKGLCVKIQERHNLKVI